MINKIILLSLRHRLAVAVCAAVLIAGGVVCSQRMDIDVLPDLTAPTVVVMADASGMTAEEVEQLVTFPIETALNGATDTRRTRSASMPGYSFVWAEFDWGTDIFRARQIVSEKMVSLSAQLPEGVTPTLAPQSSVMGEILLIGLQADSTSLMDLRTLADWVVKPAILSTGGVSQVTNMGGDLRQYQITLDPHRMDAYGVTMDDIERVGRTFSQNSAGGVVRDLGNEYALRGLARTAQTQELGHSLVRYADGRPVVLSDVADIAIGAAVKTGHASQNASPAVVLAVSKQPGTNTLRLTRQIEENLAALATQLPADVRVDTRIFRQADFIEASVSNVGRALAEGAVCAVVVLMAFLASWRTTVISVVAIPLSLLGALAALHLMGMNINTMTLGGLCLAIGSLVDDAVIDVENVYRRLRQQPHRPALQVVYEASAEIRASILNATLIIVVAFVPLFFLSGMEGRMLRPLGAAYVVSLFVSLVVAMTVTPLLCLLLLGRRANEQTGRRADGWLAERYARSLRWALAHRRWVAGGTLALVLGAVGMLLTMGQSFLPELNEGSAVISAVAQPGVSLDVSDQLGQMMERELLSIPQVTGTARRTGRGELDEHSQTVNSAEIDVQFALDGCTRQQLFDEMRHRLASVPGVAVTIGQPLGHRIDHMLSGTRASIAVKVFGNELGQMWLVGNQIKAAIERIPGLVDVAVEQQVETPQIQIRANRLALAAHGITVETFNRFISTAFAGQKIADIHEGQRRFDLVLRLEPAHTQSIEGVRGALIDTEDGRKIPLEEVAEVVSASGPAVITRENTGRKLVVSANVSGRDVGSAARQVRQTIESDVQLPPGFRLEYGGQFQSAQSATRTLTAATVLSLLAIFLLLYAEFRSWRLAAMVLLGLPFALVGGVAAARLSGGVVSIPTVIGMITLLGIATRNGILLVSRWQRGGDIATGAAERLAPILMTALTSALALVPLTLNGHKPGNEIQSPMAVVVLGGLLTSTLLNLYALPLAYQWITKREAQ